MVVTARSSPRPGSAVRASTQASGTPSSRHSTVAAVAVRTDSHNACSTGPEAIRPPSRLHGAVTSRATKGPTRNSTATAASASSSTGGRLRR
jgi:hypothetical protein